MIDGADRRSLQAVLGIMFAIAMLGASPASSDERTGLRLTLVGAPVTVYAAGSVESCGPTDLPDGAARAIRLSDGTILMMASSAENFPFRGRSLLDMRKSCHPLFHGKQSDDPAAFDDRGWLLTPFSRDGTHILGLIHNEFQGQRRAWLCPDRKYVSCWYNAVTAIVSDDSGATFHRPVGISLIAAPRYRFADTVGHQAGYFGPTDIVPLEHEDAFMVYTPRTRDQNAGNCLLASETPMKPASWKAFDGNGFTIGLSVDPYAGRPAARPQPCTPIAPAILRWPVTALALQTASNTYVALMVGTDANASTGIFYATSKDMIHWVGPAKLLADTVPSHFRCGDPPPRLYPSLLDPTSTDGSFATIGSQAWLFSTSIPVSHCHLQLLQGSLTRQQVDVSVQQ
jgi:hypothetical protein